MAKIIDLFNRTKYPEGPDYKFETVIDSEKIIINDNEFILKEEKKINKNHYVYVTYNKNGESHFVGRYEFIEDRISIENSKDYILVYNWHFNKEKSKVTINNILTLYSKEDFTEIVGTFEELGKLFNASVTKKQEFEESDSNKLIHRSDGERKRRV